VQQVAVVYQVHTSANADEMGNGDDSVGLSISNKVDITASTIK